MWLMIRELIGWALTLLGLVLIWFVLTLARERAVLEAAALSLPATIVFRSGIAFVRLATAGRIATRIATRE